MMNRATLISALVAAVVIAALAVLLAFANSDLNTIERANRVLQSDNALQSLAIATQAFNINRFNQAAQTAARANAIASSGSETTVIKYREILRREKTCDLPVPAAVAGRLLEYASRLRSRAMHTNSPVADSADGGATAASGLTYCQAVLWIDPLLATIEQGNNNFAGIREIEQARAQQTGETP